MQKIIIGKLDQISLINFNEPNKLLQGIEYSKITLEEALKRIKNLHSNIIRMINQILLTQARLK